MGWRRSLVWVLPLLACSVDSGDGFPSVGSASASASASAGTQTGTGGETTGISAGSDSSSGGETTDSTGGSTTGATGPSTTEGTSSQTSSGSGSSGDDTAGMACMGQPLDAQLAVPPMCVPTCSSFGFSNDCGQLEVCRLKDSATGVCETCDACGNLNAPCTNTIDCDILFTCFRGQCTAMCSFETPQTCGNPAACTDVGHPTYGVCDPAL